MALADIGSAELRALAFSSQNGCDLMGDPKGITALMQTHYDAEFKEELKKIDNPIDMLKAILYYNSCYGWDSYYRDLYEALWEQAHQVMEKVEPGWGELAWGEF